MFETQNLTYFTEGNTFTGSYSQDGRILRYLVRPDRENGQLLVWAWTEDLCFERAGDKIQKEFLLTEEGLGQFSVWLHTLWEEGGSACGGEEEK